MKSGYLVAGVSLLHVATAIPAYITTVFHCPDVVTITQTVYPPGWTNTGPVYGTWPSDGHNTYVPQNPNTCKETASLTTSWETEYSTTSVYYSEYGMYKGPPGCPTEIIAYMPTTVICSQAVSTGWVGYVDDIACASCTETTLVGMKPSTAVEGGATVTYVSIWTEVYIEQGQTTHANPVGSPWTATAIPTSHVYPYYKNCPPVDPPTYHGGNDPAYTHPPGVYPSINYNDPNRFHGGSSVEIHSAGWTSVPNAPGPTHAVETPGYTKGHYPSMDYNDPNVFHGGTYTSVYPYPSNPVTPNAKPTGSFPYPENYSDPKFFRPITTPVEIVSATGKPPVTPVTTTYTVATGYTQNYASIDGNASENFKPLTGGIEIASLSTAQTFATATSSIVHDAATVKTVAYPSINYNDPNLFKGIDPNSAAAQPTASA